MSSRYHAISLLLTAAVATHRYRYGSYLPGLEITWLPEKVEGLPSQGREHVRFSKKAYCLENYIGPDDWQCRFITVRSSYACRHKQGRKTSALWGISW